MVSGHLIYVPRKYAVRICRRRKRLQGRAMLDFDRLLVKETVEQERPKGVVRMRNPNIPIADTTCEDFFSGVRRECEAFAERKLRDDVQVNPPTSHLLIPDEEVMAAMAPRGNTREAHVVKDVAHMLTVLTSNEEVDIVFGRRAQIRSQQAPRQALFVEAAEQCVERS